MKMKNEIKKHQIGKRKERKTRKLLCPQRDFLFVEKYVCEMLKLENLYKRKTKQCSIKSSEKYIYFNISMNMRMNKRSMKIYIFPIAWKTYK